MHKYDREMVEKTWDLQPMHNNDQNTVSQLIKCDGRLGYVMTQITYNNAKVEESKIQEWSKTQFESLPQQVQEKLNASA